MFNLEWMLKDYDRHDLSSLKFAAYGGHAVSRPFVDQFATMAPVIGTGLGLTEAAGFCTYIQASAADREAILAGLGQDMPIYACSIRQPMRADGSAGDELPTGETGQVCFRGPQTFLGYVNDPAATAQAISRDGFLYTGDLGFKVASDRPGQVGNQVVWLPNIPRRCGEAYLHPGGEGSQLRRGRRGPCRSFRGSGGNGGKKTRG
jgi:acyl-CoA synthetase (AMP-forming)/AMP-acid ligase II